MEVVGQAPHEGQLDLLLHELEATVDHGSRECHSHKAGDTIEEALVVLRPQGDKESEE